MQIYRPRDFHSTLTAAADGAENPRQSIARRPSDSVDLDVVLDLLGAFDLFVLAGVTVRYIMTAATVEGGSRWSGGCGGALVECHIVREGTTTSSASVIVEKTSRRINRI